MSSALIIQTKDEIFIGADTAVSTTVDNNIYRIDSLEGEKIFKFKNGLIVLIGNFNLTYKIIEILRRKSDVIDVEQVRDVAKEICEGSEDNYAIDIIVSIVNKDIVELYQISPYQNFEIHNLECTNGVNMFTAGIKTEECFSIAYSMLEKGFNILDAYKNAFDTISFEGIGGKLNVFKVSKKGIIKILDNYSIKEKTIKKLYPSLIVAENVYGKLGTFAKIRADQMIAGDGGDEGTLIDKLLEAENNAKNASVPKGVKFDNSVMIGNGNGIKVLDANNNVRVNMGQYAAGKYGMKVTGGEIYSTTIQTGDENSNTYIKLDPNGNFYAVKDDKEMVAIRANNRVGSVSLQGNNDGEKLNISAVNEVVGTKEDDGRYSFIVAYDNSGLHFDGGGTSEIYIKSDGSIKINVGSRQEVIIDGDVRIKGNLHVEGNVDVDGSVASDGGFWGEVY